jgi:hypothetical protein
VTRPVRSAQALVRRLSRLGLLLKQDRQLPSVVTLVAGEALSGSWWSHREGRRMFRLLAQLTDHPDVLLTKLLCGKDTFVHRDLWPALFAVVRTRRSWQMAELSAAARLLLVRAGRARSGFQASGPAVRELQQRLLVHAREVHTAAGRHALLLTSWGAWADAAKVRALSSAANARAALAMCARAQGAPLGALPWEKRA